MEALLNSLCKLLYMLKAIVLDLIGITELKILVNSLYHCLIQRRRGIFYDHT